MFCFQCEQTEGKGINIYTHGEIDEKKDFTPVIEKALELEEIDGLPVNRRQSMCNGYYGFSFCKFRYSCLDQMFIFRVYTGCCFINNNWCIF